MSMLMNLLTRLRNLPAPGNGTRAQRIMYVLAVVWYVVADLIGYQGQAITVAEVHAETARTLIAVGIVLLGYVWPALIPRIRAQFGDDDEAPQLRKTILNLQEQVAELQQEVVKQRAGELVALTTQARPIERQTTKDVTD